MRGSGRRERTPRSSFRDLDASNMKRQSPRHTEVEFFVRVNNNGGLASDFVLDIRQQMKLLGEEVTIIDVKDHGDTFGIHTRGAPESFIRRVLGKLIYKGKPVNVLEVAPYSVASRQQSSAVGMTTHPSNRGRMGGGSFRGRPRTGPIITPPPPHRNVRPLPPKPVFRENPFNKLMHLLVIGHFSEGVLNLNGTAGVAPFSIIDYNNENQVKSLLFTIKKDCAGCEQIFLDSNNIRTLKPWETLPQFCPSVRIVSLRNNMLSTIADLDPLRKLSLLSLNVIGNPICGTVSGTELMSQLLAKHEYLQQINDVPVPSKPYTRGVEQRLGPQFCDSTDKAMMTSLVDATMALLDSRTKNLENIKAMYLPMSTFTVAASSIGKTRYPPELFSRCRKTPSARSSPQDNVSANVFKGPERINEMLSSFPPMRFERDKYYFDVLTDKCSSNLRGFFVSGTMDFCDSHLFSFTRTFYIAQLDEKCCRIVSDHLTIMPFHGGPAPVVLFSTPQKPTDQEVTAAVNAVVSSLSAPKQEPRPARNQPNRPSVPKTEEEIRKEMVERLSQETKMTKDSSRKCLEACQYDYDKGLALFREINAEHGLQSTDFIAICSDQDKQQMMLALMKEMHLKQQFAFEALDNFGWHYAETLAGLKEMNATNSLPPDVFEQ